MGKRSVRAGTFLFDPDAFRLDPAVLAMTPKDRGIYIVLICNLWKLPKIGVVQNDDQILHQMGGCTMEEWLESKPRIARAFDTESRDGWWVQKRMRRTKKAQDDAFNEARENGLRGSNKRWGKDKGDGHPIGDGKGPYTASVSASASGSATTSGAVPDPEKTTDKDLFPSTGNGSSRRVGRLKDPSKEENLPDGEITADAAFGQVFWPRYPRKDARIAAEKAWRALHLRDDDQETLDRIMAGLDRHKKNGWASRDKDKIPHASTWLNQRRWEDES